jgi:hypothetical protein
MKTPYLWVTKLLKGRVTTAGGGAFIQTAMLWVGALCSVSNMPVSSYTWRPGPQTAGLYGAVGGCMEYDEASKGEIRSEGHTHITSP